MIRLTGVCAFIATRLPAPVPMPPGGTMLPLVGGALFALIVVLDTDAAVRRVPEDHTTIQSALVAAAPNDSIVIGPGTYEEHLDAGDKYLSLIGTAGAASTIIDGGGDGRCLRLGDAGHIVGLTFQNGYSSDAGGGVWVRVSSSARPFLMEDCRLIANTVGFPDHGFGGGLYIACFVSGVTVSRCAFERNQSGLEGGGAYTCAGTWEDNRFIDNYAWHAGGGMFGGGEVARRNLFVDNTARNLGGGYYGSPRLLEFNTFVGNRHQNFFSWGAGIHAPEGGVVKHNIVWGSAGVGDAGVGIYFNESGVTGFPPELSCNDVGRGSGPTIVLSGPIDTTGSHNFSVDPEFCDAATGDFSLRASSPCAGSHPGCGAIGAFGVGCESIAVERTTWGRIKSVFR